MSSPENEPLDPQPINPPDNTSQDPTTQPNPDLVSIDEEAELGFTDPTPDPPPPAINPPDNT